MEIPDGLTGALVRSGRSFVTLRGALGCEPVEPFQVGSRVTVVHLSTEPSVLRPMAVSQPLQATTRAIPMPLSAPASVADGMDFRVRAAATRADRSDRFLPIGRTHRRPSCLGRCRAPCRSHRKRPGRCRR